MHSATLDCKAREVKSTREYGTHVLSGTRVGIRELVWPAGLVCRVNSCVIGRYLRSATLGTRGDIDWRVRGLV